MITAWMVADRRVGIAFGITLVNHARSRFLPGSDTWKTLTEVLLSLEADYVAMSGQRVPTEV